MVGEGDQLLLNSRSLPSTRSMVVFLLIFFMDTYFKIMFLPFCLFQVHFIFPILLVLLCCLTYSDSFLQGNIMVLCSILDLFLALLCLSPPSNINPHLQLPIQLFFLIIMFQQCRCIFFVEKFPLAFHCWVFCLSMSLIFEHHDIVTTKIRGSR